MHDYEYPPDLSMCCCTDVVRLKGRLLFDPERSANGMTFVVRDSAARGIACDVTVGRERGALWLPQLMVGAITTITGTASPGNGSRACGRCECCLNADPVLLRPGISRRRSVILTNAKLSTFLLCGVTCDPPADWSPDDPEYLR